MTDIARSPSSSTRRPAGRPAGRMTRTLATALAATVALVLVLGFVNFAQGVARAAPPADPRAEGIVVLTGGTARIDGALDLLAQGKASRLLISGVNPSVGRRAIAGTVGDKAEKVLDCCVDLGHDARDTIGNAAETRSWAEARGFSSLIVVTSDYHMARSMTELAGAMPRVHLIAYPVSNPELHLAAWWRDPAAFSLLVREYAKYLAAEARQMLGANVDDIVTASVAR